MSQSAPLQTSDAPPLFRHFTVGWITAIETEFLAATQILDAKYDAKKINLPTGDKNVYTLGRIGEHNVVIATLPPNIYGTRSATAVANGIQRNFPMVRVVLMVGVAGGAPAQSDVRLGDVVVGTRVVPYDFGKEHPNHLEFTGDIQVSNSTLLNGTRKVGAAIMQDELDLDSLISARFAKTERIRDTFRRPEEDSDRLYRPEYRHTESCDCLYERPRELEMIVSRPQRKSYDRIKVHCGSIGSADKVVKDAIKRDKLTLEHGLLCFEMESAGIIPLFKYLLPIRGICDYSDSHKAKQWQGYAAAAAAVYAKCFLDAIPSADLDAQIPPDADEMERYVRLVAQMVMRVISSASPGPESGLHDADNAMKEIKESVAMLVDMAKRNSDDIQRMSDEDSAAHARRHMERIESGQKEMRAMLQKMIEHISTQHAASTPEEKPRWEALQHEATEETSSLEKATKITEEAGKAVGDAARYAGQASYLTNHSGLGRLSGGLGRGKGWLDLSSKAGSILSRHIPQKNPKRTPSPHLSGNVPSSRTNVRRSLRPLPPVDQFPPPPTRSIARAPQRASLGAPPPLPPRNPSPLTQEPSSDQSPAAGNRSLETVSRNAAVRLAREPEGRRALPRRLDSVSMRAGHISDQLRTPNGSASRQQHRAADADIPGRNPENLSRVSLPPLPPRPPSALPVDQESILRRQRGRLENDNRLQHQPSGSSDSSGNLSRYSSATFILAESSRASSPPRPSSRPPVPPKAPHLSDVSFHHK